VHSTHSRKR